MVDWQENFWENLRLLAAQGIDVVLGNGVFHSQAEGLICQTENRFLVADNYLLTSLAVNNENDIVAQLNSKKNRTTEQNQLLLGQPQKWGIMGALPENLTLAQALTQQGHEVDIISRNGYLLPGEEPEIAALLQSYLENLGINFYFNCGEITSHHDQAKQVYNINFTQNEGKELISLMVDHFIRPYPSKSPSSEDLFAHLPEFKGNSHSGQCSYLAVNNFLQTVHPQIYACGDRLRGYGSEILAREEAKYVGHRLLGKVSNPIDYRRIPFGIDLDPPLYRIGLTKSEADRQGIEVKQIIHGFEPYDDHCDLRGVCKVIIDPQGLILGAHWLGKRAKGGIYLFNLAMTKGISFFELQDFPLAEALGIEKWDI